MIQKAIIICVFILLVIIAPGCKKATADVVIHTTKGDLFIKLYDDTPIHKANFLKLVNNKFYDGIVFHRIIKDFMIQAGDPKSKDENYKGKLGAGLPEYTLQPEFLPNHIHKKGALAAARQNDDINPERRSSDTQFFIVHGTKYTDAGLDSAETLISLREADYWFRQQLKNKEFDWVRANLTKVEALAKTNPSGANRLRQATFDSLMTVKTAFIEARKPFKYSVEQKQVYKEKGGAAWLDQNYTVFGELVDGFDTLERIAYADMIPDTDKPAEEIKIKSIEILKK